MPTSSKYASESTMYNFALVLEPISQYKGEQEFSKTNHRLPFGLNKALGTFHDLLNRKVLNYHTTENILLITFDDGFALELLDDFDNYESMQIYPLGDLSHIIVI